MVLTVCIFFSVLEHVTCHSLHVSNNSEMSVKQVEKELMNKWKVMYVRESVAYVYVRITIIGAVHVTQILYVCHTGVYTERMVVMQ